MFCQLFHLQLYIEIEIYDYFADLHWKLLFLGRQFLAELKFLEFQGLYFYDILYIPNPVLIILLTVVEVLEFAINQLYVS